MNKTLKQQTIRTNPYEEIVKLVDFAEDKEICVRFIEMMP